MKTYRYLIGEAIIKIGIGSLGGGLIIGLIKDKSYVLIAAAVIVGAALIHIGAKIAQLPKDRKKLDKG